MASLFQTLERTAVRGAEGVTPEARGRLGVSLCALQQADGGFAGLDGRSDLYFSLFAWLSLRALAVPYDGARLCAYAERRRPEAEGVDAHCAALLLAVERGRLRAPWTALVAALLRGDAYGAFLWLLSADAVPRLAARLVWQKNKRSLSDDAAQRLPTPRLAASRLLARVADAPCSGLAEALLARRCARGGFASAPGADADLLATAAARFSLGMGPEWREDTPEKRKRDLDFVEACWQEDGLFGASPAALHGDAEHTFYGLLALGTCR